MEALNILTSYLEGLANGKGYNQIEEQLLRGLKIIHFEKGIIRCKLLITDRVSGKNGIWQAGGILGVMDVIGAAVGNSFGVGFLVTVCLNSSFYSTAKIDEEVEIEGRVTRTEGKLLAVVVEIRRKGNREVIAKGNQLLAPIANDLKYLTSALIKTKL